MDQAQWMTARQVAEIGSCASASRDHRAGLAFMLIHGLLAHSCTPVRKCGWMAGQLGSSGGNSGVRGCIRAPVRARARAPVRAYGRVGAHAD
eukprot:6156028-Pleurochrysis_carterae.AAC.2